MHGYHGYLLGFASRRLLRCHSPPTAGVWQRLRDACGAGAWRSSIEVIYVEAMATNHRGAGHAGCFVRRGNEMLVVKLTYDGRKYDIPGGFLAANGFESLDVCRPKARRIGRSLRPAPLSGRPGRSRAIASLQVSRKEKSTCSRGRQAFGHGSGRLPHLPVLASGACA